MTKNKKQTFLSSLYGDRYYYIMSIPTIIWYIVFAYIPMVGILIAFMYFIPGVSFSKMSWVGLYNFQKLLTDPMFFRAFRNTCILGFLRIAFGLTISVLLAIFFNELRWRKFRFLSQTLSYLPYFVSWVIVAIFFTMLLAPNHIIDALTKALGIPSISMTNSVQFRAILITTDVWKGCGYSSIIFTAALMGVNPALIESLEIDGGNRWQKILYIMLPTIRYAIVVVLVLWIGAFVSMGFDQVFNMYNAAVYSTGDIIDTYIYRIAFSAQADFGMGTAAGLIKGIIASIMMFGANYISKKISGSGILF